MSKFVAQKSPLFSGSTNKAKGLAAIDNIIDRTLLPKGPVINKVWETNDEDANLVFLQNKSSSPIGRLLDATDENPIIIDRAKFSSMASVWAYTTYQTRNNEADDQLRTRWGGRLLSYVADGRKERVLQETADIHHQWTAIVSALTKHVVSNIELFEKAINEHMRKHNVDIEAVKSIEFVVPMSRSKFSRMYEEVVNLIWANIVELVTAKQVKKSEPFAQRVNRLVHAAIDPEQNLLAKSTAMAKQFSVDTSWMNSSNFSEFVKNGTAVYINEKALLTKLWAEKGVAGFVEHYGDFLLAAGMMRRHHGHMRYDFETGKPAITEGKLQKVSVQELKELVANPVYKNWLAEIHVYSQTQSEDSTNADREEVNYPMPVVSEEFTSRMWFTLRAVILFNAMNKKTRVFFDAESLVLLDNLHDSDIMVLAAGPFGTLPVSAYGQTLKTYQEEILAGDEVVSALASMVLNGDDKTADQINDVIHDIISKAVDIGWVSEEQEVGTDPIEKFLAVFSIMIPEHLEKDLEYRPKPAPYKKPYANKR